MAQKRALVTGASSGIGKALALALATEGYAVTLVARDKQALEQLRDTLPGSDHIALCADLTIEKDVERVAKLLHTSHYDLLINNAGRGVYGEFRTLDYAKFDEMMRLNVTSVVRLSHAYLQTAQSGDTLVNVASMVAFTSYPKSPVYAGTKGFILNFTQSLYLGEKARGVYVMTLCPGITRTNWHIASGGDPTVTYPTLFSETPEAVAQTAVTALKERTGSVVISGWYNKIGYTMSRLAPRSALLWFMDHVIGRNTK